MAVRLIVRRVRPTPGSQLALFTAFDYHAFVTDRDGEMLDLEADHRRHAVIEQSIAELKSAGLAHLPSSRFTANAAWLALAVIAHNLSRAVGLLAGRTLTRATAATLRRAVFTTPGRLVRHGRRQRLRLPENWPWAEAFTAALAAITPSRPGAEQPTSTDHHDPADSEKPADRQLTAARNLSHQS
jgi:Transposase DDE domain group 1